MDIVDSTYLAAHFADLMAAVPWPLQWSTQVQHMIYGYIWRHVHSIFQTMKFQSPFQFLRDISDHGMCPKMGSFAVPKNWSHESQANQSDTSDDEAIRNLGRAGGHQKHPTEKELDSTNQPGNEAGNHVLTNNGNEDLMNRYRYIFDHEQLGKPSWGTVINAPLKWCW